MFKNSHVCHCIILDTDVSPLITTVVIIVRFLQRININKMLDYCEGDKSALAL